MRDEQSHEQDPLLRKTLLQKSPLGTLVFNTRFARYSSEEIGALVFSTFPGEEGIQVKTRTRMKIFNELYQLTRDSPEFYAIVHVPFFYVPLTSSNSAFFSTEETSALSFSFTSTTPILAAPTQDLHNITYSQLQVNVSNSLVTSTLSSTLTLNMNGSSSVSANVNFFFDDDFPLASIESSSSTLATFSGFLSKGFKPATAPWIDIRTGGVLGSVRFYQRQIVVESFQLYTNPSLR